MSLAFLEYEEQFGRLWDRVVGGRASLPRFPEAAVALEDERRRLAVLFRAMGGDQGLELRECVLRGWLIHRPSPPVSLARPSLGTLTQ